MSWEIEDTDLFLAAIKEHKKNAELLQAIDKKIIRLQEDPHSVGGKLSGELHGWQSTRLVRTFRLFFKIDENIRKVYLGTIRHRKEAY